MSVAELTSELAPALPAEPRDRVLAAALRCVARWGVAKTSLDDVAREADMSRATVYRVVPGGKDGLIALVVESELHGFFLALDAVTAGADSLEDALVAGMTEATRLLRGHTALQFVLAHEPERVLPRIAFGHLDDVLARVAAFAGPLLSRWLSDQEAAQSAEWLTRIVLSYTATPSASFDLADAESTRRLVCTFVLPGLRVSV